MALEEIKTKRKKARGETKNWFDLFVELKSSTNQQLLSLREEITKLKQELEKIREEFENK